MFVFLFLVKSSFYILAFILCACMFAVPSFLILFEEIYLTIILSSLMIIFFSWPWFLFFRFKHERRLCSFLTFKRNFFIPLYSLRSSYLHNKIRHLALSGCKDVFRNVEEKKKKKKKKQQLKSWRVNKDVGKLLFLKLRLPRGHLNFLKSEKQRQESNFGRWNNETTWNSS